KQRAHWTGFLLGLILLAAAEGLAQSQSPARPPRQVVVSLRARKLAVLQDGAILGIFQIAVGADSSPSPTGEFEIVNRVSNPTYYHAGQVIPCRPQQKRIWDPRHERAALHRQGSLTRLHPPAQSRHGTAVHDAEIRRQG